MVIAPGRNVHGAENFFVLDIRPRYRKDLCAQTKFADLAGGWIALEEILGMSDGRAIAAQQSCLLNTAARYVHQRERSVLFESDWELALSSGGHPIDFASGEIGDFPRGVAHAVAFLSFLAIELDRKPIFFPQSFELNHDIITPGQRLAKPLGLNGDIVVVPRQAAA